MISLEVRSCRLSDDLPDVGAGSRLPTARDGISPVRPAALKTTDAYSIKLDVRVCYRS